METATMILGGIAVLMCVGFIHTVIEDWWFSRPAQVEKQQHEVWLWMIGVREQFPSRYDLVLILMLGILAVGAPVHAEEGGSRQHNAEHAESLGSFYAQEQARFQAEADARTQNAVQALHEQQQQRALQEGIVINYDGVTYGPPRLIQQEEMSYDDGQGGKISFFLGRTGGQTTQAMFEASENISIMQQHKAAMRAAKESREAGRNEALIRVEEQKAEKIKQEALEKQRRRATYKPAKVLKSFETGHRKEQDNEPQ